MPFWRFPACGQQFFPMLANRRQWLQHRIGRRPAGHPDGHLPLERCWTDTCPSIFSLHQTRSLKTFLYIISRQCRLAAKSPPKTNPTQRPAVFNTGPNGQPDAWPAYLRPFDIYIFSLSFDAILPNSPHPPTSSWPLLPPSNAATALHRFVKSQAALKTRVYHKPVNWPYSKLHSSCCLIRVNARSQLRIFFATGIFPWARLPSSN